MRGCTKSNRSAYCRFSARIHTMAASKSASAAPHAVPVSVSTPRVSNRRLAIAPVRFISADAAVAELLRTFHERLKRYEINARSFRAAAAARK